MTLQKTMLAAALIALFNSSACVATEIYPNSESFNLTKYFYKDPATANLKMYHAAGFYKVGVPIANQKIFILPKIEFKRENVTLIGKNGITINDWSNAGEDNVARARIRLLYDGTLPNRQEAIGILSQVTGTPHESKSEFLVHDFSQMGFNVIDFVTPPNQKQVFIDRYKKFSDDLKNEDALYADWLKTAPQVVAISSLNVKMSIDGEIVAERSLPYTVISNGFLPDIYAKNLTEYQLNRIKENGMEILVEYTFKDQKTSSITAEMDFKDVMERVVNESYSRVISGKSKGFQFLGFGSRKSTMKQSVKEYLSDNIVGGRTANTNIQMEDADDSMISAFNDRFFPKISQEQVVANHLAAASKASSEGKKELAEAHRMFAADIQNNKLDLHVDTDKAMAALSRDDYAGFIAHGLKIGSSSDKGTFEFSRVLSVNAHIDEEINWKYVKTFSAFRTISQLIEVTDEKSRKPYLGLCDAQTYNLAFPEVRNNMIVPATLQSYFVPTCILAGSPLLSAGVTPGMVIKNINGANINTVNDLNKVLDSMSPGDEIPVTYMEQLPGPAGTLFRAATITVKLGVGTKAL